MKWTSPQKEEEQTSEMDEMPAMKTYRLIEYAKKWAHECSFVQVYKSGEALDTGDSLPDLTNT